MMNRGASEDTSGSRRHVAWESSMTRRRGWRNIIVCDWNRSSKKLAWEAAWKVCSAKGILNHLSHNRSLLISCHDDNANQNMIQNWCNKSSSRNSRLLGCLLATRANNKKQTFTRTLISLSSEHSFNREQSRGILVVDKQRTWRTSWQSNLIDAST